jgi:competence protein ComEC
MNHLQDWLLNEHTRWILWVPIAMAFGVLLYFAYRVPVEYGVALLSAGLPALVFWRRWLWLRVVLLALALIGLGILAIHWEVQRYAQPLLERPTAILTLEANLEEVIREEGKQKLVLSELVVEKGISQPLPYRIRLSLKKPDEALRAGQRIRLRAGLFPLPPPALPGSFDFTRHFYFKGIGVVGFALNPVEVISEAEEADWQIQLANFRTQLSQHIIETLSPYYEDPAVAAIANALITGERAGISEESKEAMRVAGLAHMLAISGLHLGLVTGVLFLLIRYFLLFIPTLALRYPIKKWAAFGALLGGMAYLILANFPVSAQRAYIMVALILLAVILDRQVISMRSLALAAIVILLIMPASLMGPSFQLSFAATMAIIALFEWYRDRRNASGETETRYGVRRKVWLYFSGVMATTFVASLITAPYTIYHFNQLTSYHLLANLVASPIFSFLVMPAGVVAMLLMPLGLDMPFLWLMGYGIELILQLAYQITEWPYAMNHVPTPPVWTILLFSLGAIWFCFWRENPRHLGWGIMIVALIAMSQTAYPLIVVSPKAEQIAIRTAEGYAMVRGRQRNFNAGLWQEFLGIEEFQEFDPDDFYCDLEACHYSLNDMTIALPKRREILAEECSEVDLIITRYPFGCDEDEAKVIGYPKQAYSVYLSDDQLTLKRAEPFTEQLESYGPENRALRRE